MVAWGERERECVCVRLCVRMCVCVCAASGGCTTRPATPLPLLHTDNPETRSFKSVAGVVVVRAGSSLAATVFSVAVVVVVVTTLL